MVQTVENPPAMLETWVPALGWEDPLEEGMETHLNKDTVQNLSFYNT